MAERLTPEREQEIREAARGEARLAPRAWMTYGQELLAEIDRLRQQRKYLVDQLAKKDARSGDGDRALREFLTPDAAASSGPAAGDKQPETCACGPQMRCKNGHSSRHYMCQDCGNCCSCECAGGAR